MHSPENLLREALTLHSTYKSVVYVLLLLRDLVVGLMETIGCSEQKPDYQWRGLRAPERSSVAASSQRHYQRGGLAPLRFHILSPI